ncbi:lysophospholipid acyltransferase family protein [Agitococcus lubricus]|uniref:1-acyl-sn-glycerol-3-phosphate acyltransferase n=1 Tax=Agitococcus lubricus TaxID=1077255 RepID=A0A2T5IWS9_9GAMM|nr:lysophospholipid acyltransferase family protein [Agitococcus lubricus]PTQ88389.1 1-acyl-sn-glycerol-3-phosphate acyltransferase [Agitococcus lubricus]
MSHRYQHLPERGNSFMSALGQWMLKITGWKIVGDMPDIPKAVMIGAPHTSNLDGFFAFATIFALDIKVTVMAKHSLFKWGFGYFMRWLGAIPIDRQQAHQVTQISIQKLQQSERMLLCLAPDGTRTSAQAWKTGFHRIAYEANVPIILWGIDFDKKEVQMLGVYQPTADMEYDISQIQQYYVGVKPHHPERLSKPLQDLAQRH